MTTTDQQHIPAVDLLDTDPAAGLRVVAKRMRERANATTSKPWYTGKEDLQSIDRSDAAHIASFANPPVALAVAELLDHHAWCIEQGQRLIEEGESGNYNPYITQATRPLNIARAYLTGEVQS